MDSIIHVNQAPNADLQPQNSLFGNNTRLFESQMSITKKTPFNQFLMQPQTNNGSITNQGYGSQSLHTAADPPAGSHPSGGDTGSYPQHKNYVAGDLGAASGTSFLQMPQQSRNQGASGGSTGYAATGGDYMQNFFDTKNSNSFLQGPPPTSETAAAAPQSSAR